MKCLDTILALLYGLILAVKAGSRTCLLVQRAPTLSSHAMLGILLQLPAKKVIIYKLKHRFYSVDASMHQW